MPNMRTAVVEKLPTKLKLLPEPIWVLIRPEDWSAFPSKNASSRTPYHLTLTDSHIPYIPYLPNGIRHIAFSEDCTRQLELASVLPRNVSYLFLPLGSPKQVAYGLTQTTLETISRRIWRLKTLVLFLDTFSLGNDLSLLSHLKAPYLRTLYFVSGADFDPTSFERPTLSSVPNVPLNFASLRQLHFESGGFLLVEHALLYIFNACPNLEELSLFTGLGAEVVAHFPASMVPLLPPKLNSFEAPMDILDADTFRSFPRTLTSLEIAETKHEAKWYLHELLLLPRIISYIALPQPKTDQLSQEITVAALDELAKFFDLDPHICLIDEENTVASSTQRPSLSVMIITERHSRNISKIANLPAPTKRKHGE